MSPAKVARLLGLLLLFGHCVTSLIIPEELPTLLSVIYSNIPPIKKGTDSRLGLGFRLGEHADFQVLLELGPQKETDPIGNDPDSKTKRAAVMIAAMKGDLGPWAQAVARYQMEQKLKQALEKYGLSAEKQSATNSNSIKKTDEKSDTSDWLSKWSQGLATGPMDSPVKMEPSSRKPLPHVNRMRVVDGQSSESEKNKAENDLNILKKLFGNANETVSSAQ